MQNNFLILYKKLSLNVLLFFVTLQIAFFFSIENFLCVIIAIFGWIITNDYLLKNNNFLFFPLSSTIIFGFSLTQFFLPICFTILEWKPLIFNLIYPYQVFLHSLLALIVLVVVHNFYKVSNYKVKFKRKEKWQKLLISFDFFQSPTENQLWFMGFVGISATLIPAFFGVSKDINSGVDDGNIFRKLLDGFLVFSVTPYFILIKNLYGAAKDKIAKVFVIKIIFYTLTIIIVGIIANSRGLFMTNLTAIGICYLIALFLGKYPIPNIKIKNITLIIIAFFIIVGPLSDIGTAMVTIRGERDILNSEELLIETFKAYNDKSLLKTNKEQDKEIVFITGWDENYFDNIFISRFCNLKFNDNSLSSYNKIGKVDADMIDYSIYRFFSIFPLPLIKFFNNEFDKNKYVKTSFGDYLFSKTGAVNALGGLRVGQFAGVGMATFGWWYLLVLAVGVYPLFFMFDLFAKLELNNITNNQVNISVAGLVQITSIFLFFTSSTSSESVTNIFGFLIRGWPQIIFLYIIIIQVSKIFK